MQKGKYMIQRLKFAFFILLAGGAAWFAPTAKADVWNKETVLTFSGPVEIPGQVLPAGTYVFKLADSQSNRDIVQVFSEDQTHLLATIIAIPDYRNEPADKTIVTFAERQSGSPQALRSWFYPGDNIGVEFVYSKSEAQPAVAAQEPAPTAASPAPQQAMAEPPATEQAPAVEQAPATEQSNDEAAAPIIEREQEVIIAQAAPAPADDAPPAQNESVSAGLSDTLPQTAGNFASIPLLGILLLSGGFATIRFATKRS
jgi:hypothetical protein